MPRAPPLFLSASWDTNWSPPGSPPGSPTARANKDDQVMETHTTADAIIDNTATPAVTASLRWPTHLPLTAAHPQVERTKTKRGLDAVEDAVEVPFHKHNRQEENEDEEQEEEASSNRKHRRQAREDQCSTTWTPALRQSRDTARSEEKRHRTGEHGIGKDHLPTTPKTDALPVQDHAPSATRDHRAFLLSLCGAESESESESESETDESHRWLGNKHNQQIRVAGGNNGRPAGQQHDTQGERGKGKERDHSSGNKKDGGDGGGELYEIDTILDFRQASLPKGPSFSSSSSPFRHQATHCNENEPQPLELLVRWVGYPDWADCTWEDEAELQRSCRGAVLRYWASYPGGRDSAIGRLARDGGDRLYEVLRILRGPRGKPGRPRKTDKTTRRYRPQPQPHDRYLVEWVGYRDPTWEPYEALPEDMLQAYIGR